MIDILDVLLNASLIALFTSITMYVMSNIIMKNVKKDLKREAEEWLNSEKGQKAIYSIGLLLGNAIMTGSGLGPAKSGGKLKLQDILMQGLMSFFQGNLKLPTSGTESPKQTSQGEGFKSKF